MTNCYWWIILRFYLSTCWEVLKKCQRKAGWLWIASQEWAFVACLKALPQHSSGWKEHKSGQSVSQIHVKYFLQRESVQCTCVLEGKFHEDLLPCSKTFYLIILFVQTVHGKAYVVLCLQYSDKEVEVHFVTGDHIILLDSKECATIINVHFVTGDHLILLDSKECATIINQQMVDNEGVLFKKSTMSEGNKWWRPSRTIYFISKIFFL